MIMKPLVSVICITYNHERYIRKCLDGFIMQKTSFPFEVIVHDDASTDKTACVIREYEEKYPEIIKPIYQTENQYSKGNNNITGLTVKYAKGKYIAMCEGDDFWNDPDKLEKQVSILRDNPTCKMCVHKVQIINEDGTATGLYYPQIDIKEAILSPEDFVSYVCDEKYFQTSSYFFDGDCFRSFYNNLPEFRKIADVGDDPLKLFFADLGPVYYQTSVMSCYRQACLNAWSNNNWATEKHFKRMIKMMELFDDYSKARFHTSCLKRIRYFEFLVAQKNNDYKTLLKKEYRESFKNFSFKAKVFTYLSAYCPWILKIRKGKSER